MPDPDGSGKHPRSLMMAARGKNIVLLHVKLKNAPGAMLSVVELVAKKHLNILSGYHETPTGGEVGDWTFFMELRAEENLEQLLDSVRKLEFVVEASGQGPSNFLVDATHFPLLDQGERLIAFMAKSFIDVEKSFLGMMGRSGETILYHGGKAAGKVDLMRLRSWSGLRTNRELVEQFCKYCLVYGLGNSTVQEFDEAKGFASFIVRDSVEASLYVERQAKGTCHFLRGMIAGVMEELFSRKADAKEVGCKAMGHEHCVFQVTLGLEMPKT